ncbi:protein farnesyltransferase subunit beta isoform X2 [Ricinus communis]|uniref:protein farnesyltransferase subunit beta isoform X2 n=1 Tax=Ricinus communis TaxID=3988 RepID=UPI00077239A3|nr:protein farnesyltransferase subunit beta isoform X2 [Ricinus communis]|eukprot:XP_015573712.1 protein farnesyltransferase subunit beta isoform X2 [Ricinus communis]
MDCVESSSRRRATASQHEQWIVQDQVFQIYDIFANIPHKAQTLIRPWLCYWILHSIALLGESIDYELENNAIDFLNRCQDPNGGFGGGPGQLPHLATTYAAVNSLVTLGGPRALSSINRGKLYTFLRRMKDPSGPFRMHDAGEIDVRACYTAISVANILNILDDELVRDVGNYILSCQTYEGGIAGEPGSEAHGGYTFCGLATMILINEVNRLDLSSLINWVVFRQGVECGFQGRTNKLVDGCYSFWQGGVFALLQRLRSIGGEHAAFSDAEAGHCATESSSEDEGTDGDSTDVDEPGHFKQGGHGVTVPLFHSSALQQYIILCSQEQEGGFRDKPGKARDYYHTCYCLSGLSVCQYSWSKDENSPPLPRAVLGPYSNLLEPIHPLYNVVSKQYDGAHEFFSSQSSSY